MSTKRLPIARYILPIYALCFAGGALSHTRDFIVFGWCPYDVAPLPLEVFWSSLVLIDLLMVLILLSRHRRLAGMLALGIMLADVAINIYATIFRGFENLLFPLVFQSIFLGFILGSIGFVPKH